MSYIVEQSMRCVLDFITEDMGYTICHFDEETETYVPTRMKNEHIINVLNLENE